MYVQELTSEELAERVARTGRVSKEVATTAISSLAQTVQMDGFVSVPESNFAIVRSPVVPGETSQALVRCLDVVGNSPMRVAFMVRLLNAGTDMLESLEDKELGRALSADTNYQAMIVALQHSAAPRSASEDERTIQKAKLAGLQARQKLLAAEGGTWPVTRVAAHLSITRQAVDRRRRAGRLLGLPVGHRGFAYPAWQFNRRGVLEGLEAVLADLADPDPWTKMIFFLGPREDLAGLTPLAALRKGKVAAVRDIARNIGEHGAA